MRPNKRALRMHIGNGMWLLGLDSAGRHLKLDIVRAEFVYNKSELRESFLFFLPIRFSRIVDRRVRLGSNRYSYELSVRLIVNHYFVGHNRMSVSVKFMVNINQTFLRNTFKTIQFLFC